MEIRVIDTGGITALALMEGSEDWYWGTDYTGGDLYEAEELFRSGHPIRGNRLVLVRFPEGRVYEPVPAQEGCYFGNAVFEDGRIHLLWVDFSREEIGILRCGDEPREAEMVASLSLKAVRDCYNLMLHGSPLTLCRQGHENRFQVLWPEEGDFPVSPRESLDHREGDVLLFSEWREDPEYRESQVLRRYPTGKVLERLDGTLLTLPHGQHWLLKNPE